MTTTRKRTKAANEASYRWLKSKTHRVCIDFRLEDYNLIENAAKENECPVSTYIRKAVNYCIENKINFS